VGARAEGAADVERCEGCGEAGITPDRGASKARVTSSSVAAEVEVEAEEEAEAEAETAASKVVFGGDRSTRDGGVGLAGELLTALLLPRPVPCGVAVSGGGERSGDASGDDKLVLGLE
jgi:hypothetical protein